MQGAGIGTDWGIPIDSTEVDPVWETATGLDVPIFMHPAPCGIDGPSGDPRLRRFELDVVVGFNLESTVAVSTLVFGGVLSRHPTLDVCFPSGGGAVPFVAGRLAAATVAPRPWVDESLRRKGALNEALQQLWFDTHVHDDGALRLLREHVGDDRLVFGTVCRGHHPCNAEPDRCRPLRFGCVRSVAPWSEVVLSVRASRAQPCVAIFKSSHLLFEKLC